MKSFKDYVIEESRWSRLIPKFDGDINNSSEIEAFLKQNGFAETTGPDKMKQAIASFQQSYKDTKTNGAKSGKQTFLDKFKESKEKALAAIKRLQSTTDFDDVKTACQNVLAAASVITEDGEAEAVDSEEESSEESEESQRIEQKIRELDEIVAKHGIDINKLFVDANEIERDDIADQIIVFLKKLGADKNVIIGSSKSMKDFLGNADRDKNNILTPEELQMFVSSKEQPKLDGSSSKVDDTVAKVLPFIIFILWLDSVAPDVLKKVNDKTHGKPQGEGVSESFNATINTIVSKNLKLDYKKEPFKILGSRFENDMLSKDNYDNLVSKLKEIANALKKKPETFEKPNPQAETPNAGTSNTTNNTTDKAKAETEKNNDATETQEVSDTPETQKAQPEKGSNVDNNSSAKSRIINLTRDSTKQEVQAAIEASFGTSENPDESEDGNRGPLFANIVDAINKAKKNNQSLYDVSHKKPDSEEESASIKTEEFFFDCADNKLVQEGLLDRKIKAHMGRVNISNNERNENSWNKCLMELRKKQTSTLSKAKAIMAKLFDNINSVSKKGNLIVDLKKLESNYQSGMTSIYTDYRRANSYNGLGAFAHDVRVGGLKAAEKAKEAAKNSKAGQEFQIVNQNIDNKLKSLTVETLDKYIPEDLKDVFAYAVMSQSNPNVLQEPDIDSDTGKVTVEKAAFDAVANNNEVFGVGDTKELSVFLSKLLNKANEDKDLGNWFAKYKQEYNQKKEMAPIITALFDLKRSLKSINSKLKHSTDPKADILSAIGANNIAENVSSLSFKDYYLLTEAFGFMKKKNNQTQPNDQAQNQAQQAQPQQAQNQTQQAQPQQKEVHASFSDEEIKGLASLCLLAAIAKPEFKYLESFAAKTVLNKMGRDARIGSNLNENSLIKAANKFVERNGESVNQSVNILAAYLNKQEEKPAATPATTQTATQTATQEGAADQTADTEKVNATVTTSAVGDSTIPDRLYKKLIRRRINSFV